MFFHKNLCSLCFYFSGDSFLKPKKENKNKDYNLNYYVGTFYKFMSKNHNFFSVDHIYTCYHVK